jgi:hypothetical protein
VQLRCAARRAAPAVGVGTLFAGLAPGKLALAQQGAILVDVQGVAVGLPQLALQPLQRGSPPDLSDPPASARWAQPLAATRTGRSGSGSAFSAVRMGGAPVPPAGSRVRGPRFRPAAPPPRRGAGGGPTGWVQRAAAAGPGSRPGSWAPARACGPGLRSGSGRASATARRGAIPAPHQPSPSPQTYADRKPGRDPEARSRAGRGALHHPGLQFQVQRGMSPRLVLPRLRFSFDGGRHGFHIDPIDRRRDGRGCARRRLHLAPRQTPGRLRRRLRLALDAAAEPRRGAYSSFGSVLVRLRLGLRLALRRRGGHGDHRLARRHAPGGSGGNSSSPLSIGSPRSTLTRCGAAARRLNSGRRRAGLRIAARAISRRISRARAASPAIGSSRACAGVRDGEVGEVDLRHRQPSWAQRNPCASARLHQRCRVLRRLRREEGLLLTKTATKVSETPAATARHACETHDHHGPGPGLRHGPGGEGHVGGCLERQRSLRRVT